jgi:lysine decarboxylase
MTMDTASSAAGVDGRQPTAPYLDALVAYGLREPTRFHVPGHKGGRGADPGLLAALGVRALQLDIPQDTHGVDVGPKPTPYEQAEQLAAAAYGAQQTWFLSNGATQGNHALCLALARPGTHVVVQRNAHGSIVDGLVLSGAIPTFVKPATDDELGMAHGVTPDALRAAFARIDPAHPARAAFVVSPTYYGMTADVAALAEIAHAHGAALVVDQSWGPHFGFHPAVPESALKLGADAVLTSTHKIVGSFTQSAMLHVVAGGRVDADEVARAVRLVRSTSPNSLLLGSLDGARRYIAVHGEALLSKTVAAAARACEAIDAVPGASVIGTRLVGEAGVHASDPLRIVIDVRGTGHSGYEVSAALRAAYDIHVELATHATLVLVLGIDQPVDALERFAHDFAETVRRLERRPDGTRPLVVHPPVEDPEFVVTPREAFLGVTEVVAVEDAIGRVSCESIAGYPPGIPALMPGERVSEGLVAYLRELAGAGARLHGASDPDFRTITVLRDAP